MQIIAWFVGILVGMITIISSVSWVVYTILKDKFLDIFMTKKECSDSKLLCGQHHQTSDNQILEIKATLTKICEKLDRLNEAVIILSNKEVHASN